MNTQTLSDVTNPNIRMGLRRHSMSKAKAMKILRDGSVRGHAITKKQRGLFGIIAAGKKPRKRKRKKRK